jgi:hypothetical protein
MSKCCIKSSFFSGTLDVAEDEEEEEEEEEEISSQ